jgi:hypothetical protein
MAYEARTAWKGLLAACERVGLPEPKFNPARLGDKFECKVLNRSFFGEGAAGPIEAAITWVDGYEYRMELQKKAAEEAGVVGVGLRYAAECAQKVVDSNGMKGPFDHVLIAKAILAITKVQQ